MQEIERKSMPSKKIPASRAICTRSTDTTNGISGWHSHVVGGWFPKRPCSRLDSLPNESSSLARLNDGTALKDRGRPIHPSFSLFSKEYESTHIGQHLVYLFHLLIYLPSKVGQKFPQELLVISALLHGLVPVDYTLGGHDCSLALCVVVSIGGVVSLLPLLGLMSGTCFGCFFDEMK